MLRFVPFRHQIVPQGPCRPKLGDLLKEIVVAVEKERQARSKSVNFHALRNGCIHVRQCVGQREGHLLNSRRTRFSNMVA